MTAASALLAAPQASPVQSERVKAAFLAKFASFVEWPASAFETPDSPIVIGVVSADPIAAELESAVAGRSVAGRPLAVRRIGLHDNPGDCCQVLFVAGERARMGELLEQAQGRPILTITDRGADHPRGSVINFVSADDRVRFDIARNTAERNGLRLGSQLLGVAREVKSQ